MPSLIWAATAVADVERLYRFLYLHNPDAARRAVKAIRSGVKVLMQHPRMGHKIEGMPETYRQWLIDFGDSGYVVRYRLDAADRIAILAVWHQKEAGE